MGIGDELQKLDQLRQSGSLTEEEFKQAKSILLANPNTSTSAATAPFVEEQLAQVRYQNELTRIDREWEIEREQYRIVGRYGRTYVPTLGMGIGQAIGGGILGAIWTMIAVATTSAVPDVMPFSIIRYAFPIFGLVFTLSIVGRGISCCHRAQKYNDAYQLYKDTRASVSAQEETGRRGQRNPFTQME